MKKYLFILITLLLIFSSQYLLAHGNHAHAPINNESAFYIASNVATQLTQRDVGLGFGKLSKSWSNIQRDSIKMHEQGPGYYIVSLKNDKEGKSLYILMSDTGDVYDVNFTGHFPKLKK